VIQKCLADLIVDRVTKAVLQSLKENSNFNIDKIYEFESKVANLENKVKILEREMEDKMTELEQY